MNQPSGSPGHLRLSNSSINLDCSLDCITHKALVAQEALMLIASLHVAVFAHLQR